MGPTNSARVVSDEHHWFMHTTTSDKKLPLTFLHMQSTSVGGQPFCRTQLVMQVGNAACTREEPKRAAYRRVAVCCFANILPD